MTPEEVTVAVAEESISIPAAEWAGKCYYIACAIVEHRLVDGHPVYGHFVGDVHPESFFGQRADHPFVQHGWVQLPDGRILDPTRWSFENAEPYIWLGENDGSYDEGGNQFRMATMSPWPEPEQDANWHAFYLSGEAVYPLEKAGVMFASKIDDDSSEDLDDAYVVEVTTQQVFWLANLALQCFGDKQGAHEVFTQIVEHDLTEFIPLDNRKHVLGEQP